MLIYGGSKETVEKQLKCEHKSMLGPFIDKYFRYYKCKDCFVCNFDVNSEKEYYETLIKIGE